jgi:hypothetical protein
VEIAVICFGISEVLEEAWKIEIWNPKKEPGDRKRMKAGH